MANPSKQLLLFTNKLGYQTRSFEEAARKMVSRLFTLRIAATNCRILGATMRSLCILNLRKPRRPTIIEALRGKQIDGIMALGDRPVVAAAYAARELGIPYHHPAAVEACRSKLRMREVFRDTGLRTPWFRTLALNPLPEPALLNISYPCVLKPLSLSASQGVIRANNREEFVAAAQRIAELLASPEIRATRENNLDQILVEGYIPGREVAVEGVLTEGVLRILAIFDKPDPLEGPYFEETIYVTPSSCRSSNSAPSKNALKNRAGHRPDAWPAAR